LPGEYILLKYKQIMELSLLKKFSGDNIYCILEIKSNR
jgi:hypothetical protein